MENIMKTTSPTSQLTHLGNFFAKRFAPVALFVMATLTMITGNDSALLSAYPWLILAWPTGMLFLASIWLRSFLDDHAELETVAGIDFRHYPLWNGRHS